MPYWNCPLSMLLTMHKSPEIAGVTNPAPNHLNVHKGMEEYVEAKANILRVSERRAEDHFEL